MLLCELRHAAEMECEWNKCHDHRCSAHGSAEQGFHSFIHSHIRCIARRVEKEDADRVEQAVDRLPAQNRKSGRR